MLQSDTQDALGLTWTGTPEPTFRRMIGVVTVTYNSAEVIEAFLRSALAQSAAEFLLYIIDNASSDSTLELIARFSDPRIHLVANPKNVGVAEGNNQGILLALEARCDRVLLINNDTEFEGRLFEKLAHALDKEGMDMIVPKIMYFHPKSVIWCAGGAFRRGMGFSTLHFGDGQVDVGKLSRGRQVEYAPTCCMMIRAKVFRAIGLMDPAYFVYWDDTDFCWRAREAGIGLWYEPSATLYHKVGGLTGGHESVFTIRYATRNKVYFVLKNLNALQKIYCLAIYHLIFIAHRLTGRDSASIYRLKCSAYLEGIMLYRKIRRARASGSLQ